MASPCALITSCSTFKPTELIKMILSVDILPNATHVLENISSFPWHIDTKYYSADVDLCVTDERTVGNQMFAQAVEAFVVVFDTMQLSSFDQVKMWLPYLEEIEPVVKILVCDRCSETDAIPRHAALVWCIDNAFELVELNPADTDDGSDEDDFKETLGVQRIIEALRCHSWPNMVLKENPTFRGEYFQKLMNDTALANASSSFESDSNIQAEDEIETIPIHGGMSEAGHKTDKSEKESNVEKSCVTASGHEILESLLSETDENLDLDDDSFDKLFEKLHVMKEAASSMPLEQRKKYAEDVVVKFWKAIGGSEEEIEGLSDSDDNV